MGDRPLLRVAVEVVSIAAASGRIAARDLIGALASTIAHASRQDVGVDEVAVTT